MSIRRSPQIFQKPGGTSSTKMRWSSVFQDKLDVTNQQVLSERAKLSNGLFSTIVKVKYSSKLRDKLKSKIAASREKIDSFRAPVPTIEWQQHWGSAHDCSICHERAVTDLKFCMYCDNVAHRLCILDLKRRRDRHGRDRLVERDEVSLLVPSDRYICAVCVDSRKEDEEYYAKQAEKHRIEKLREFYQHFIARKIIKFWREKQLRRQVKAYVLFQSYYRRRIATRDYQTWKRAQRRVLVIEMATLPKLVDSSGRHLLVLTVVDPIKHSQLFRIDKKPEVALTEGFFIPGVNAYVILVLTVCVRKDDQHYIALAQSQFVLRDVVNLFHVKSYRMSFTKSIQWLPQEVKKENLVHVAPANVAPPPGHTGAIGSFFSPTKASQPGSSRPAMFLDCFGAPQTAQPDEEKETDECIINYIPQSPISSRCISIYGPPVDVLRKVADMNKGTLLEKTKAAQKAKLEVQSRRRKWWVVLCDLRLYFYESYGDSKPKLVVDISEAEASIKPDYLGTKVSLVHSGLHVWTLECQVEEDAIKLLFAILESKKCFDGQCSMYMRLTGLMAGRDKQYGYAHIVPGC